jgi:HlyD family secretion protein
MEESERVVTAGTPLIELSNTSKLELVVDVLSTDAVEVKPGARVLVDDWGGGTTLEARVRLVEPSAFTKVSALGIEEQRVNVVADFVDSAGPLGDGYRVEAHIVTWEDDDVLKIPTSALFRQGQGWRVFLVEDGEASLREVETGQRTSSEVEVTRGLEEGAEVIIHPSNQISDGARVEPQRNTTSR